MDERKLEELFRDAASAVPPASFDEQDVIQGARRVTARRRMTVAGGSLAAAAVLVGVGVGSGVFDSSGGDPVAAPPTRTTAQNEPRGQEPPRDRGQPSVLSLPGTGESCGAPDEALGEALSEQLPEVGATSPVPARGDCVPDARSASFVVRQGNDSGRITVFLGPASSPAKQGPSQRPDGTQQYTEKARSGHVLTVLSDPDDGSQPLYADRLNAVADGLAGRF